MHGIGFELPLQEWFDFKIPNTTINDDFIVASLENEEYNITKPSAPIIWLGGEPIVSEYSKSKKGNTWQMLRLSFFDKVENFEITLAQDKGEWLLNKLKELAKNENGLVTFSQLKKDFESQFSDFELFWYSKPIHILRERGLLVL